MDFYYGVFLIRTHNRNCMMLGPTWEKCFLLLFCVKPYEITLLGALFDENFKEKIYK